MKKVFATLLVLIFIHAFAEDTIKVMHYNTLRYGDAGINNCTPLKTSVKNLYLKTIIDYTLPDIFTVNELGKGDPVSRNILINALNQNQRNYYKRANYQRDNSGDLENMLFYDNRKIGLKSQNLVFTTPRQINHYKLYLKNLDDSGDTIYFNVFIAHFKAGSSSSDKNLRGNSATALMNYIKSNKTSNNIFCGDLNLQSSSEQAWKNLTLKTADSIYFVDPIDKEGSWNNNASFAAYHTQSTRTSGSSDCGSSGGLDDRFDFILIDNIINGKLLNISYIDDSYEAVGQDGNRFNGKIDSPTNRTVPSDVAIALNVFSDHLPVSLKLSFESVKTSVESINQSKVIVANNKVLNLPLRSYCIVNDLQGRVLTHLYPIDGEVEIPNSIKGMVLIDVVNSISPIRLKVMVN